MRNIAISDIHGCCKTFKALVENHVKLTKEDHLYLLGDYIDRGPDSKGVIDYIFKLKEDGFQVTATKGNHEQMLLRAIDGDTNQPWYQNGARMTLRSFEATHEDNIPTEYIDFIKELKFYIELEDCFLVHAGFNFEREDPLVGYKAMLWSREMELDNEFLKGRRIIHGHTPVSQETIEFSISNQAINIDGGCVFVKKEGLGNLCAFDFTNNQFFFQPNIDVLRQKPEPEGEEEN